MLSFSFISFPSSMNSFFIYPGFCPFCIWFKWLFISSNACLRILNSVWSVNLYFCFAFLYHDIHPWDDLCFCFHFLLSVTHPFPGAGTLSVFSCLCPFSYWVGHKVHSGFAIPSYGEPEQTFWPTQYISTCTQEAWWAVTAWMKVSSTMPGP